VRWQVINLRSSARDMHDSLFLYISGEKKPQFSDDELHILRTFVHQGGTILSVTECDGEDFSSGIRETYCALFPDYALEQCPPDHPIYSSHYKLEGDPKIHILSNGVRPLALHVDKDIAKSWQVRATETMKNDFMFLPNMVRYTVGRFKDLRSRGEWYWPAAKQKTTSTIKVALLKHQGNWRPEPLAWTRFANILSNENNVSLRISTVDAGRVSEPGCKVASLTGTGKLKLTEGELEAIAAWVRDGGTLVVDAANSSSDFYDSARKLLEKAFDAKFRPLAANSRIYSLSGNEIGEVRYRSASRKAVGETTAPKLESLKVNDREAVILSWQDITSGLIGYPSGTARGYECDSAFKLMRNIVLTAK
jgi:hypothetical protein